MKFLVTFCILALLLSSGSSRAEDTRGLKVVAKDALSGQAAEVGLYRRSFAVIIGIDRYRNLPADRQLKNAVKDARGVEAVLRKSYRFDKIVSLHDEEATKDRILEVLTEELPAEMGRDDALLVFWAGHGNQEKSDYGDLGYLIPYDGSTEKIRKNLTMAELRDTVSKKIPAKHVFYVMDACYSGLLTTRSVDSKPRRDLGYLKEITKESVRQVLTAGGKGEEALDGGPKGHSVFTGRLIELLESATDYVTANELQASIRERVYSDAAARNHTQRPGFGVLYGMGDFVFIPRQQDRLGDLSASSAARQKELEQLQKMEQEAAAAKKREEAELARKQSELDALDRQIADMKARLGAGSARSGDGMDELLALAEQKEEQGQRLEELRRQREAEEQKRQQEIERLKTEAIEKKRGRIEADLAKYKKIASSKYAQDMKPVAWKTLVASYPEAGTVAQYDERAFRRAVGLAPPSFRDQVLSMEFVAVQGGCFQMGDNFGDGEKDEKPVHEVCVDDFSIGKFDVTRGDFAKFVDDTGYRTEAEKGDGCNVFNGMEWKKDPRANWRNSGLVQDDRHPVVCVSWNDAQAFAEWLTRKDGRLMRLPTEGEWEYAARSGGQQEKFAGFTEESVLPSYANFCDSNCQASWRTAGQDDGYRRTSPVGKYQPNGLGLYDMTGNVWQWTGDWYGENYYGESPRSNPQGPSTGSQRVLRGGSWNFGPVFVRAADRHRLAPGYRDDGLGFRLVAPVQ